MTNQEVLRRMNIDRQLLKTFKRRKIANFELLMRNEKYKFIQSIIKSTIEGCQNRGRNEIWLRNIQDWTGYRDEANILKYCLKI